MIKPSHISWLILLLFLGACQAEKEPSVKRAFYHWKTYPDPAPALNDVLNTLQTQVLYWRIFDIDWSEEYRMPVPLATAEVLTDSLSPQCEIIPAIFITNITFKKLKAEEELLDHLIEKVRKRYPAIENTRQLQLDCDWTAATQAAYFSFLNKLKNKTGWQISVTVRLHQLKDKALAGIPPADRGVLMFYNMGELSDWQEPNSILNLKKAEPYLRYLKDYPLELDLALPIFSWAVIFRTGKMIQLKNNIDQQDLADRTRFEKIADFRYLVKKSTYLEGLYLYEGDLIRLEMANFNLIENAIMELKPYFKGSSFTLALYHLDTTLTKRFSYEQLDHFYKAME